jgi:hypothetical protein
MWHVPHQKRHAVVLPCNNELLAEFRFAGIIRCNAD